MSLKARALSTFVCTRGAALPQTPSLALIRHESNVLGFVVTAVIDSGSTGVVVAEIATGSNSSDSDNANGVWSPLCVPALFRKSQQVFYEPINAQ